MTETAKPKVGAGDQWIVVPRWEEFQHPDAARSMVPPWIKEWTRQLADDAYLSLTFHQRGVLHGIRLEYARSTRQLRDSTSALSRRLGHRVTTRDLEALNHAGFIAFNASKPASKDASTPARPEKRREERSTRARANGKTTVAATSTTTCPICTVECRHDWKLLEHLENVHNRRGDDALDRALLENPGPRGGGSDA